MTTPRTLSGMPCWVTQSIWSSVSRRSSDSRRTTWMPGMTMVPLPVMILKPRLSPTPSGLRSWSPEMTSASLGSATRHIILKSRIGSRTTTNASAKMTPTTSNIPISLEPLVRAHDHRPRREVLDHHHARPAGDGQAGIRRVGVERLASPAHGDHHFADASRCDGARDPSDLADQLTLGHGHRPVNSLHIRPEHLPPKKTRRHRSGVERGGAEAQI